ncbi:MAG: phosphate ABC transporter permease PstA [Spirochaetales bacterium]|nr:MAG: phosphate ABC transporter permease PstA [Spirochaetales bacterium]
MSFRKRRRKLEESVFKVLMYSAVGIVLVSLGGILLTVCIKGIPGLSWEMISKPAEGGFYLGKGGGILNAIIGSIYLAGGAVLLAFALSIIAALFLRVTGSRRRGLCSLIRFTLDVLTGVPSIVYGAFGFTLMLALRMRASLLGGIITVAILILPIMIRAMDEAFNGIPEELLDASYSLGANRTETAFRVVLRQAVPGIVTAVLISFGRAIGDAASVIFTAGFSDNIPTSLSKPAATLPLAIFFQLGTPYPEVRMKGYTSAFVLTVIILAVSIAARLLGRRLSRNVIS